MYKTHNRMQLYVQLSILRADFPHIKTTLRISLGFQQSDQFGLFYVMN